MKNASVKNTAMRKKTKLPSALLCYSSLSALVGFLACSSRAIAGELAELPYEAGNWTPPKVYILLDNSESMRSETVVPPGNEALFPTPGVREGIVAQWDELYFRRFVDPAGARLKFITGVALPGVHTVNTSGASVLSPNTQCNIIDPTKNTLYFDSSPTHRSVGYLPWIWWGDSTLYPGFSDASLTDIPSWFRYGSCSGGIKTFSDLPATTVFPTYTVSSAANGSFTSDYAAWTAGSLSRQDAANWWKYHSTRSKLVQGALSDAMDYLKRELIFGIRELNGPVAVSDMQLNLGTDLAPDSTVGSALAVVSNPLWVIPPDESAVSIPASAGLDFNVNIAAQNYLTGAGVNEVFDQNKIATRNVAIINSLLQREDLGYKVGGDGITRLRPKHSIGRTPLRTGLHSIGRYFEGGTDNACQRTFALVVTDGYWNEPYGGANPSDPITGDQDGDTYSQTFADIASYFYKTGFGANGLVPNDWNTKSQQHMSTYVVSMGLQGNLPVPDPLNAGKCHGDWPPEVGAVNPLPLPPTAAGMAANWGDPQAAKVGIKHTGIADAERVDDLWHAAYNSRGRFVNTNDAYALAQRIFYSFKSMHEQSQSFDDKEIVSGIELNMQSTPKKLYVSSFNPASWSGSIKGYNLKDNGDIDGVAFNNVSGFAESSGVEGNIFTFNTTSEAPVDFNYASLGEKEKVDILITESIRLGDEPNPSCPSPVVDPNLVINFLKGDKTNEGKPPYDFRERKSSIGDIVHSKPVFVGNPGKYYKDKWANQNARENKDAYSNFVSTVNARLPMLYVGANDGYLHGFKADDGVRYLSYIPSFLLKDIGLLADVDYTHQYFMDGQIAVDDVCLAKPGEGCDWITMLVGGAGAGGQGLFAIDVTKPGYVNASKVLWEFTDLNNNSSATPPHEADLGYVIGTPNIGRFRKAGTGGTTMDAGQWLVVFGGGYHNTQNNLQPRGFRNPFSFGGGDPATTKSATGQAFLYMLNAKDGTIMKKIGVPGGTALAPNGIGSPALIDADSDDIIDYIYFGDLLGRLWKIDVRNENPDKWFSLTTTLSGSLVQLTTNDALFTAPANQPIAVTPLVVFHPSHLFESRRNAAGEIIKGTTIAPDRHKLMVYFGTGKFFEKGDSIPKNQLSAQAFYAIYDDGTNQKLTRTNLQARAKTGAYSVNSITGVANGSTAFATGVAGSPPPSRKYGWYLQLHATNGERIVADADYRAAKDRSGSTILSESKVFFNIMVPSAGGNCQVVAASVVNGFSMVLDPLTGNNAYYDPSAPTVAKGGVRLSRSAGFSNIRTQGFNGGSDRLFLETQSADGATNTLSSVSVGSSDRYHRESFLQLTQ